MEIKVRSGNILAEPSDLAVLGVFADVALPAGVAELLVPGDFKAGAGQTLLLYPRAAVAPTRLLLVGLGDCEKANAETIRQAGATAVKEAQKLHVEAVTVGVNGAIAVEPFTAAQAFAEGVELGAYRYQHYQTGLDAARGFEVKQATLFSATGEAAGGVAAGQIIARGVRLARDLVNGPGYAMHPPQLGEEAIALGKRVGLKTTVLDMAALTEQGFGGILAVGKGSEHEPRFIVMEYGQAGPGVPTICLVGKGLTFDSGGLSLKPAEFMETMKSDMAGAAAVFGAMQAAAELKLPVHLVGLISSAENMPSSNAYRPGDVIKTLSGKTVEVLNTDAEGRIILADALFYAQRYNPQAIVELATLTGAIIVALGAEASGLFATDQALQEQVIKAGEVSGERVWPFPMWEPYHRMIKSKIADIVNIGPRGGGSITAATFLAAFVGDFPLAHLDIAGTGWVDAPKKAYDSWGGTGVGVRLLIEYLRAVKP